MRLSSPGEKYEFDATFYALAVIGILIVGGAFWYGKRMIDRANGREIQRLITTANLDTPEAHAKQARNYVAPLADRHKLSPSERKQVEAIYADALFKRARIWSQDRMNGIPLEETRRKQQVVMDQANQRFSEYLRSVGK